MSCYNSISLLELCWEYQQANKSRIVLYPIVQFIFLAHKESIVSVCSVLFISFEREYRSLFSPPLSSLLYLFLFVCLSVPSLCCIILLIVSASQYKFSAT